MSTPVGAAIVTYNSQATIATALRSLKTHGINDMVIVDNASADQTVKQAQPSLIIENETNLGFARAVNQAVAQLKNEYIFLLNPDAELADPLDNAIAMFTQNPNLGIIGLGLYDHSGHPERFSFGAEPTLFNLLKRKMAGFSTPYSLSRLSRTPPWRWQPTPSIGWVSAGAMLIRRSTWEQLQGFDPEFFMYWEDVDFCRRARQQGWKVARSSHVKVRHLRGASSSDLSQKTRLYDASADRYFKKHYAWYIWGTQRFGRAIYRWLYPRAR